MSSHMHIYYCMFIHSYRYTFVIYIHTYLHTGSRSPGRLRRLKDQSRSQIEGGSYKHPRKEGTNPPQLLKLYSLDLSRANAAASSSCVSWSYHSYNKNKLSQMERINWNGRKISGFLNQWYRFRPVWPVCLAGFSQSMKIYWKFLCSMTWSVSVDWRPVDYRADQIRLL